MSVINNHHVASNPMMHEEFFFNPFLFQQLSMNSPNVTGRAYGRRMVCDEFGNFYLFGGASSKLLKCNTVNNTWTKLTTTGPSHPGKILPSVLIHGGRLIAFGGKNLDDSQCTNHLSVCDLNTLTWQKKLNSGPTPRCHNAMILHQENLYIVGGIGTHGEYLLDVHELNLRTNTWTTLWTDGPSAVGSTSGVHEPKTFIGPQVALRGNEIIVFGVNGPKISKDFSTILAFDVTSRTWTRLAAIGDPSEADTKFPPILFDSSFVQKNQEVFLIRGFLSQGMWKLSLADLTWTKLIVQCDDLSYCDVAALSLTGCLFILYESEGKDTVWKCWLGVPTLKEMCWEAVHHIHPNLKHHSKDKLVQSGISKDLVRRIDMDE